MLLEIKVWVERCRFKTKNQMLLVKKPHCKMWICLEGYRHQVSNAYSRADNTS